MKTYTYHVDLNGDARNSLVEGKSFKYLAGACELVREVMGWETLYLSDSWDEYDVDTNAAEVCWRGYETAEERDADQGEVINGPRIRRVG